MPIVDISSPGCSGDISTPAIYSGISKHEQFAICSRNINPEYPIRHVLLDALIDELDSTIGCECEGLQRNPPAGPFDSGELFKSQSYFYTRDVTYVLNKSHLARSLSRLVSLLSFLRAATRLPPRCLEYRRYTSKYAEHCRIKVNARAAYKDRALCPLVIKIK